jgi:prepilin-type N-terminal cleavage/methylation domain-containing protein
MKTQKRNSGFSLIELVIVIVILGIIAAIAIPRISSGSKNAGEAALRGNLQTLRNAIDWYYGDHNNTFPGVKTDGTNGAKNVDSFINQLSQYSNAAGDVSASKAATHPFGPYLRSGFPKLTVDANAGKGAVGAEITTVDIPGPIVVAEGDGSGWAYNFQTGEFVANADDVGADGKTYDKW